MKLSVVGTLKQGLDFANQLVSASFGSIEFSNQDMEPVDMVIFSVDSEVLEEYLLDNIFLINNRTIAITHNCDSEVIRTFSKYVDDENVLLYRYLNDGIREGIKLVPKGNFAKSISEVLREMFELIGVKVMIECFSEVKHWENISVKILTYLAADESIDLNEEKFNELLDEIFYMLQNKGFVLNRNEVKEEVEALVKSHDHTKGNIITHDQCMKLMKHVIYTGKESNQDMEQFSSIYKKCQEIY